MKVHNHEIPDILIFEPPKHKDNRGFFIEFYNFQVFESKGVSERFVQDNYSFSRKNVLRGLHFQVKRPQGKLIGVLRGNLYDVAVDLRRSSPTFGKWVSTFLSSDNLSFLWIPKGFAHGFYTLSNSTEVFYKVTDYYVPEFERTLVWNDPDVNIDWQLQKSKLPILSAKDTSGSYFRD